MSSWAFNLRTRCNDSSDSEDGEDAPSGHVTEERQFMQDAENMVKRDEGVAHKKTPWSIAKFNAATRQPGTQISKKSTTKRRGSKPATQMKVNLGSLIARNKSKSSNSVKDSSAVSYLPNRPFRPVSYANSSPLRPPAAAEASHKPMSSPIRPCNTFLSGVAMPKLTNNFQPML